MNHRAGVVASEIRCGVVAKIMLQLGPLPCDDPTVAVT